MTEILVYEFPIEPTNSSGNYPMSQTKNQKPQRELPKEQQKVDEDVGEEENLPAIMQEAFEMEEEMVDIRDRTNPDGSVVGYVKEISTTKKNGTIAVDVDLPAEPDLVRFHYKKPKNWTMEWEWVRFVEEYVGGPQRIANFIDMTDSDASVDLSGNNGESIKVKVRRIEDDYEIVVPKSYRDYLDNHRHGITKQSHPVWRLIPLGVGLWSGLSLSILSGMGLVGNLLNFLAMGTIGFVVSGFFLLVFGAVFLGWGDE